MTHSVLHFNTSAKLQVLGLIDSDDNYQNAATVTLESFTVRSTGDSVSGLTYPAALSYVAASNGNYELQVPASVGVVVGGTYLAKIKAVSGSFQKEWTETVRCRPAVS